MSVRRYFPLGGILVFNLLSFSSFAALNGSYTIDPGKSSSSSNYQTIASAINDMVAAKRYDGGPVNGKGISGPVTFNIASGDYYDTLVIPSIPGASNVNKITFKANETGKVRIHPSGYPYMLRIDASHLIFSGFSFTITKYEYQQSHF